MESIEKRISDTPRMSDNGFFGQFGGKYVAEILRRTIDETGVNFEKAMKDNKFLAELSELQRDFIGRPTPMLHAKRTSDLLGGAQIYVKLEGLANTGAHKINNAIGQVLLAKYSGKTRIIAETGAGQHGVATAAACARLGMKCTVYMGEIDMKRQQPNVASMELYGAKVVPVLTGSRILKDAINEAMRDWAANFETTHYVIGSALGPDPFPDMVRTFQSFVGRETKSQLAERGLSPDACIACVGGGSNAIGFFEPYINEQKPRLIAVEAGGIGPGEGNNAVRMAGDAHLDILHGYKSKFLVNEDGQVNDTRSISAGLDYAGIGPQLAYLGEKGRIEFTSATDSEALNAVKVFAQNEGVLFALESAHAGSEALKLAKTMSKDKVIVINMSGRGDKDIFITSPVFRPKEWGEFLQGELERLNSNTEIHSSKITIHEEEA